MPRSTTHSNLWAIVPFTFLVFACGQEKTEPPPPEDDAGVVQRTESTSFPESHGFGAVKADWRDAQVVIVDKLTDTRPASVPGELRHSVEDISGPKIIVFRVAGTIELKESMSVMDSDVYIAGQSAPAGGITIKGDPAKGMSLIHIGRKDVNGAWVDRLVENVTVRYLRLRLGKMTEYVLNIKGGLGDNLTITNGKNIVLDHLSASWSNDENISFWVTRDLNEGTRTYINDVTMQHSLLAEPISPHNVNFIVGSTGDFVYESKDNPFDLLESMTHFSIHRNVFTHASHRNPMIQARSSVVSNNLVYNWESYAFGTLGKSEVDFVDNWLTEGAGSLAATFSYFAHQSYTWGYCPEDQVACPPGSGDCPACPANHADPDDMALWYLPMGSVHNRGNYADYLSDDVDDGIILDPFALYVDRVAALAKPFDCANNDPRCLYNLKREQPIEKDSEFPLEIAPANELLRAKILEDVGASARVDCDGRWVRDRDRIDDRIISEIETKSGSNAVADQEDVGGYLPPFEFVACADADEDGMPDAYEVKHGFDPQTPDSRGDVDLDGHVNIMEYLNGTDPNAFDQN